MRPPEEDTAEEPEARPSRSEQTRAATEISRFALALCKRKPFELDRLELPEVLREELDRCQRMKLRARGRQLRRIAQLLRAEDCDAIRTRLASLDSTHEHGVLQEKANERWRQRLVEEGAPGIEALLLAHPDGDRQQLRTLVRNAQQDAAAKSTKRAQRELLRLIRSLRSGAREEVGDAFRDPA